MYRHALPPGFVLKSQRKAMEAAARADVISLEEFIEVEVRPNILYSPKELTLTPLLSISTIVASQTAKATDTCHCGDLCKMEADKTR